MRISQPASLKLSRDTLLHDVVQQLAKRYPEMRDVIDDPADPGWLLLEQAAWIVEQLSEQLDEYPRHAVQHLLHLAGHSLHPAQPALGVTVLETPLAGRIAMFENEHHPVRFFALSTEVEEPVEYVPIEPGTVPMVPGEIVGVYRLESRGDLVRMTHAEDRFFPDTHAAWLETPIPLEALQVEDIHFSFPVSLRDRLAELMSRYNSEPRGWMSLAFDGRESANEVGVRWRVGLENPRVEYFESEETGVQALSFPWRELPLHPLRPDQPGDYDYRPPLKLRSEVAAMGARLVLAANGTARIEVGRGGNFLRQRQVSELVAMARPIPARIAEQFYQTLLVSITDWNERSSLPFEPSKTEIFRRLPQAAAATAPWLSAALQNRAWDSLFEGEPADVVHIRLADKLQPGLGLRFGLVLNRMPQPEPLHLQVFALSLSPGGRASMVQLNTDALKQDSDEATASKAEAQVRANPQALPPKPPAAGRHGVDGVVSGRTDAPAVSELWRFTWPAHMALRSGMHTQDGGMPLEMRCYETNLPPAFHANGLLCVVSRQPLPSGTRPELRGVTLNPLLIANAPLMRDGRAVSLSTSMPESLSLLWGNVVTRDVLRRLEHMSMPETVMGHLRSLPLARVQVPRQAQALEDWVGMGVDPTEGRVVVNAPELEGQRLSLRRGDVVRLLWYRRTDGARANVMSRRVVVCEQSTLAPVPVRRVSNPLPMIGGQDAETSDQGIARLFSAPLRTLPVTSAEFEQWARLQLAELCSGWTLRCWGEAERSLLACDWWVGSEEAAIQVETLQKALTEAGPRALLMVVGLPRQAPAGVDFEKAQQQLLRAWEGLVGRLPTLDTLVVAPFVPLTHETRGGTPLRVSPESPRFDLKGLDGWLLEGRRVRPVPAHLWFYLNAAIVKSRAV